MKENTVETAHVVASIAHDLRSPLNAVIGFSRLMLKGIDGPLSEMQVDDLEAIHANGRAMLQMVDSLIDLAKAEAGWFDPARAAVYLQPLLEKVVSLLAPAAREKQIQLVCASGDAVEPIDADPSQIQKVLQSLVEATMDLIGSGTISIVDEAVQECVLVQLDGSNPAGLPPDVGHRLAAFRTAGASTEHRLDATALQLLASKQLLALNGSTLEVGQPSGTQIRLILRFSRQL
jgi:K+-sensing histidine kinase KdpD